MPKAAPRHLSLLPWAAVGPCCWLLSTSDFFCDRPLLPVFSWLFGVLGLIFFFLLQLFALLFALGTSLGWLCSVWLAVLGENSTPAPLPEFSSFSFSLSFSLRFLVDSCSTLFVLAWPVLLPFRLCLAGDGVSTTRRPIPKFAIRSRSSCLPASSSWLALDARGGLHHWALPRPVLASLWFPASL